ncbi:MAG TPA: hypothetical protein VME92_15055, partial [Acetobacteraceae bacterium]|nr:hypothetical protein [Acetobacteraceae bacterium]
RPICLLRGFGDSSVNLELRFWIEDARAGTANVESEVLLGVWDRFQANSIEIPFPQRDLHLITPESDEAAALASHLERPSQRGISRAEVGPADEVARKAQPPR